MGGRFEEPLANLLNEQHRTMKELLEQLKMKRPSARQQQEVERAKPQGEKAQQTLVLDPAQRRRLQQQMQQVRPCWVVRGPTLQPEASRLAGQSQASGPADAVGPWGLHSGEGLAVAVSACGSGRMHAGTPMVRRDAAVTPLGLTASPPGSSFRLVCFCGRRLSRPWF